VFYQLDYAMIRKNTRFETWSWWLA